MVFVRSAALLFVALLGFPLFVAGCSGGGGATPPVTPGQTTSFEQNPASLDAGASSVSPDASASTLSTSTAALQPELGAATLGIPLHVMTATNFWGYGGTPTTVPISAAQAYLTWVMPSGSLAPVVRAAGLKVISYVNFWRNYSTDYPKTGYYDLRPGGAHFAAAARTCSGAVIKDPTYGGGYEADARSSAALGHARLVIGTQSVAHAVLADDTGAMGGIPLPCGFNLAAYKRATVNLEAQIPYKMFLNTLGAGSSAVSQADYAMAPNVLGAMCELCITANEKGGDVPRLNGVWDDTENAEIKLIQNHKIFWLYARASGPATEYRLRNYAFASFLLAYDPNYAIFQEILWTPHAFPIMPETGLVPMQPVTTASNVTGYARAGGTFMREFRACYYRGVGKGGCAVVVNPSSYTRPVPTTAYAHSMVLSGSGVLDGGTVSFRGSRPSSLPSGSGVILFH